ncbi:S-layer domain protein [Desulforamulus reducens MI-1]|uniref:S-layer domain protein n=1 Tax=Desulforamulus reducens (strain ATCC BAA-1160 / DSM 100696 / MI-1) TaxID=349161 RepID=A4J8L8_DESRM|nr:S-layer homology domain-containing protein [Desulforamulus reducens]ABO51421.1 S-layer domain protein [Desulforamulus reducens MI-1]
MKGRRHLFVLILVFSLLTSTYAWAASSHLYRDTTGKWWEQSVAECSAADLVGGRGQGIFDPKAPVSQLEVIVFLNRAMGHRAEADNYSMSAGGYNFPKDFPEWAKKNVAFAADKGYISKAGIPSMKPKNSASRAEVAVLFANALKLSADGYQLNFKDKSKIPSSLQSYVAAAVKHGVMSGRPDNTFDPNASVTRAEMAAIISRLFENGKINPNAGKYYMAKLTQVDATGQKITVLKGGQTVTLNLQADSLYYWDGKKISAGSLKVNENIRVVIDATGKVVYIANTKSNQSNGTVSVTTTYTGTIKGLISGNQWMLSFQPDTGTLNSYPLLGSVSITQSGATKDLTALTSGARAEIKVTGGSVTEIKLLSSVSTDNGRKGYVVNMYLDYFTVRYDDGTSEEIDKRNVSTTFLQMSRGQRVSIGKVGSIVSSIVPLNETKKVFGDVIRISSSDITIEDGDGYERTYSLASGYRIKDKDGDSLDRDEVEKEEFVEIELNSKDEATTIRLTEGGGSSSAIQGEVTELDTSGSLEITIEKTNGDDKSYDVDDDVDVYDDGKRKDFDDIRKGDYVKLKLDKNDDVTRIDILDVEIVKGKVTEVDDSGSWGITIENSSGKEKTYDVSKNVDVYEGSKSRKFDQIDKKDYVKLIFDNDDDEVITIIITDDDSSGDYEGTITKLDDDEITIKGKSTKTYDLARNVKIQRDGKDLYVDEVLIGSECEVTIDDDEVEKIKITDDEDIEIEGELYSASSSYIYLKQDNGKHKLYFADNADLEDDDGDDIDEDDLDDYEGKDVEIELRDGKIKSLEVK